MKAVWEENKEVLELLHGRIAENKVLPERLVRLRCRTQEVWVNEAKGLTLLFSLISRLKSAVLNYSSLA